MDKTAKDFVIVSRETVFRLIAQVGNLDLGMTAAVHIAFHGLGLSLLEAMQVAEIVAKGETKVSSIGTISIVGNTLVLTTPHHGRLDRTLGSFRSGKWEFNDPTAYQGRLRFIFNIVAESHRLLKDEES